MELVSITDSECVNDSFHNSFSDGCSDTKNMELGGEEQCNVSSDNPSPQNHGTCIVYCLNFEILLERCAVSFT